MTSASPPPPEDRISYLPDAILHSILSRLPVKEAGRTTVLSKAWAHHFRSVPDLHFSFVEYSDPVVLIGDINHILADRTAIINSVAIVANCFNKFKSEIRHILSSLFRLRLKKLRLHTLGHRRYRYLIPDSIFSCETLTCLTLSRCTLTVPAEFTGLRKVRRISLHVVKVKDDHLENLIVSCCDLEELVIFNCFLRNLVIRSDKLATLEIDSHLRLNVSILNAPCLKEVVSCFDDWDYHQSDSEDDSDADDDDSEGEDSDVDDGVNDIQLRRFLQSLTNVRSLILNIPLGYTTTMSGEERVIPKSWPVGHQLFGLKTLSLNLDLSSPTCISVFSCLILSCPVLEELRICFEAFTGIFPENADYWGKHPILPCMVYHLKNVKLIVDYNNRKFWFEVAKFILKNASVLEKMIIFNNYRSICDESEVDKTEEELVLLPKASADVVLVVAPLDARVPYF